MPWGGLETPLLSVSLRRPSESLQCQYRPTCDVRHCGFSPFIGSQCADLPCCCSGFCCSSIDCDRISPQTSSVHKIQHMRCNADPWWRVQTFGAQELEAGPEVPGWSRDREGLWDQHLPCLCREALPFSLCSMGIRGLSLLMQLRGENVLNSTQRSGGSITRAQDGVLILHQPYFDHQCCFPASITAIQVGGSRTACVGLPIPT